MITEKKAYSLWIQNNGSKIIQITGKAGSGKSTLAMFFSKFILKSGGKLLWMDTERKTTQKRLINIVGDNCKNILVTQPKTYEEQETLISIISQLPLLGIIIDTISQHFRFREKKGTWTYYSKSQQAFYENHILPLLVFQEQSRHFLIFVHQNTYVPDIGDNPFMFKLFKKIQSEWILL